MPGFIGNTNRFCWEKFVRNSMVLIFVLLFILAIAAPIVMNHNDKKWMQDNDLVNVEIDYIDGKTFVRPTLTRAQAGQLMLDMANTDKQFYDITTARGNRLMLNKNSVKTIFIRGN